MTIKFSLYFENIVVCSFNSFYIFIIPFPVPKYTGHVRQNMPYEQTVWARCITSNTLNFCSDDAIPHLIINTKLRNKILY